VRKIRVICSGFIARLPTLFYELILNWDIQSLVAQIDMYRSGVQEWSKSAAPLGLSSAPQSVLELEETIAGFVSKEVATIAMTPPIVKFILTPPFSKGGLFFYRILANAAIATIDEPFLKVLGLKKRSKIWLRVSRKLLDFLSYMLGHESPSQKIARARIQALQ
jgi:hypothetical protein